MNSSVLETSDGILWIGGGLFGKGGLASYDRNRDKWTFYGQEDVPVELYRTKLFESSDDALWVTGDGQTVSRLEYSQSQWTTLEGLLFQAEEPGG